jgi:hypothetical protein
MYDYVLSIEFFEVIPTMEVALQEPPSQCRLVLEQLA